MEVLRQAEDALMQVYGRILGIVLNMVTHGGDGYSYYGRRYEDYYYSGYPRGAESGS